MKSPRAGLVRTLIAGGALAACGVALTAAALSDSASVDVEMDGSANRFDIVVAGRYGDAASTWVPSAGQWRQGNPGAYEIPVAGEDARLLLPGSHIDGRIAVKNDSPRLTGLLTLSILDPQPRGSELDPGTGNFVELFDQLIFTVREGQTVRIDHVPADQLASYVWAEPFAPGEEKILDVSIEMSEAADNRWQLASTEVLFAFGAVTP
ncbi:hypothetical protein [Agromyces archimandritae]|uniref:Uncharacterized protein n=1 Tax=Agromyces archimandritae TaxID=2781962 RepID=A0A975FJ74_9MICO|nr:hypothetical protein [Agromyces archimandritae]QTX03498.1 hypothetical protein G127AT_09005 [Agromyces archimandritae]